MVERHLRSVQQQPEIDLGSAVHPLLEDSVAIVEPGSVTFGKPLVAEDVVHILGDPINNIVAQTYDADDIHRGLKKLLYPNSRPMKNAGLIDPKAPPALLAQRPQIKGLMGVLDHPNDHEMVSAKVRVFGEQLAELAAWDTIGDMKPSQIQKYAEEFGIAYDGIRVWRAKGGDRHNKPASVAEMGLDGTSFVDQFIAKNYRPKTTIPGQEDALIPVEDLPAGSWVHEPGYVQLIKQLPPKTPDELGDRWEVLLRREDTPVHVVRAKIMWGSSALHTRRKWIEHGQEHGGRTTQVHDYSWVSEYRHLVHESTPPVYNPINHTVEHTSTLLGAALLAHSVDRGALAQSLAVLRTSNHARPSRWQGNRYPAPWVGGALIPMLHSPYLMARLLGTESFLNLQALERQTHSD
ncbi:hypothetical protein BH09PAT4_BH09PAT4_00310 [soil metagenome]